MNVSDYQQVHKGDLLVELEDDDYQAQVAQASAAVEAAKAAIENNRRQRELQTRARSTGTGGIDQAQAANHGGAGGKGSCASGFGAHPLRTPPPGGSYPNTFNDAQKVEQAVADEEACGASGEPRGRLEQAKTMLRSSEMAAEAERRGQEVLESQETATRRRPARRKRLGLPCAQVNLGYTKDLTRPAMGQWANGRSVPDSWSLPERR